MVLYWQAQFLVRVKKSYFSLALGEIYHLFQELSCHVALGRHVGAKLYHYVRQKGRIPSCRVLVHFHLSNLLVLSIINVQSE